MKIRDLRGQPRPRAYYLDQDVGSVTADHVLDDDAPPDWVDTGLLDEGGKTIFRPRRALKFGFVS